MTAVSADAFQTVQIDVDQLVGFEQRFNLRPAAGEQSMVFVSAKIAEPQMDDSRRRRTGDDPIRKIRILAHDGQIMLSGEILNLRIGWIPSDVGQGDNRQLWRKPQTRRHIAVEQTTLHAARTREK